MIKILNNQKSGLNRIVGNQLKKIEG